MKKDWSDIFLISFVWGAVAFVLFVIILLPFECIRTDLKKERLMKMCMEDGRKEYECQALLKSGAAPLILPPAVIVPHR